MKSELIARPTEFLGTVYRSKCEAMFAYYLKMDCSETEQVRNWRNKTSGFNTHANGFLYEPNGFAIGKWVPDFVRFDVVHGPESICGMPCLWYSIIEYKPSAPTNTYIAEWANRCNHVFDVFESKGWIDIAYRSRFLLYYGSVFNDSRSLIQCDSNSGWFPCDLNDDWLINYEDAVRDYRFDLNEQA